MFPNSPAKIRLWEHVDKFFLRIAIFHQWRAQYGRTNAFYYIHTNYYFVFFDVLILKINMRGWTNTVWKNNKKAQVTLGYKFEENALQEFILVFLILSLHGDRRPNSIHGFIWKISHSYGLGWRGAMWSIEIEHEYTILKQGELFFHQNGSNHYSNLLSQNQRREHRLIPNLMGKV